MVIYTTIIQIQMDNEIIPVHQRNSQNKSWEKVKRRLVTDILLSSWFFSSWKFCQRPRKRHYLRFSSLRMFQTCCQEKICWISQQSRSQLGKVSGRTGICATMWTERAQHCQEEECWSEIRTDLQHWAAWWRGVKTPLKKMRWCISRGLSFI